MRRGTRNKPGGCSLANSSSLGRCASWVLMNVRKCASTHRRGKGYTAVAAIAYLGLLPSQSVTCSCGFVHDDKRLLSGIDCDFLLDYKDHFSINMQDKWFLHFRTERILLLPWVLLSSAAASALCNTGWPLRLLPRYPRPAAHNRATSTPRIRRWSSSPCFPRPRSCVVILPSSNYHTSKQLQAWSHVPSHMYQTCYQLVRTNIETRSHRYR